MKIEENNTEINDFRLMNTLFFQGGSVLTEQSLTVGSVTLRFYCMVLHIHQEKADALDLNSIAKEFAKC